jgi:hypothetical protein
MIEESIYTRLPTEDELPDFLECMRQRDQGDEEELRAWFDVMYERELEEQEELDIWFEVMMENERREDEAFREEMYQYMDKVFEQEQKFAPAMGINRAYRFDHSLKPKKGKQSKAAIRELSESGYICKQQEMF